MKNKKMFHSLPHAPPSIAMAPLLPYARTLLFLPLPPRKKMRYKMTENCFSFVIFVTHLGVNVGLEKARAY